MKPERNTLKNIASKTVKEKSFLGEIEHLVNQFDISYLEAINEYLIINNLDPESVAMLVRGTPSLKAKIEMDAEKINLMKTKTNRLPI